METEFLAFILAKFFLHGPFEIKEAPFSLIHKTFFVRAKEGEFVAQKLHQVVRPETCEDAKAVCDYGRRHGLAVPEFLMTQHGKPWYKAPDGSLWRAMNRLPGSSRHTVQSPKEAYATSRFLGKFHAALAQFSYECKGVIPHFHDTPHIFEQFKGTVQIHEGTALAKPVSLGIAYLLEHIPQEFLPLNLPRQIIHGDPKISNFLFHESSVTGLVDFDTCIRHITLVDIGDALRSWCNRSGEDAKEPVFDRSIYDAALAGYASCATLHEEERALIPQAFRLITLELAMRFLKDYFDDSYFGWDPARFATRREHNLVRAQNQILLHRQVSQSLYKR